MPAANLVTVGMPVHNDPSGLLRSVPTVFNQTWDGDIRLLIVDDGSDDATQEVIAALQGIYDGIEVIRNVTNRGRPFARNQILDGATGEYLAWLDAGDLWHPRKLEIQFETLARYEKEHDQPILCTSAFRWIFTDNADDRVRVPDTSGDQLHKALTSALPPYLWTLLGRTSAFRSAGRFDERLPRRQDYEFFVRFIERGGLVVSTPAHPPLATYLKSDVGRSPRDIAASNAVIREIHAPLYDRYGPRFARQMRRRQTVLLARFYANNGKGLMATVYRLRGWLWAPTIPSLGGIRRRVRRWVGSSLRGLARTLLRVGKPLIPLLRRAGITSRLRKMATSQGPMSGYYRELQKMAPGGSEVAATIEDSIEGEEVTDVATWLRLEQAYRQGGRLESAQSALDRGEVQHPESAELQMRSIELSALRGRWAECVASWESLPAERSDAAAASTYNRVAWSLRELGRLDDSVHLAETGLRRWPGDPWLLAQLHKSRALATDWGEAIQTESPATGTPGPSADALVTDLGFLGGEPQPVRGWLNPNAALDTTVQLKVNGEAVATTGAAGGPRAELVFSFNCSDLLEYLGDGDVVSFETGNMPIPIAGHGISCVYRPGYPSRVQELRERLARGFVFENLGRLTEGNTQERKKATLDLYEEVRELLLSEHGYQLYPIFGNLLGAIRENDFIAHDVGGFDVVYVSSHSRADSVREEFASICRLLVDHGYHLKLKPWSAYVRPRRGSEIFIDLNHAWFNDRNELTISYGSRNQPVTDPQRLAFPREAPIGSHWVPVPGNAEEVLNQIYGPTWVTPDQGYVPEVAMKRDDAFMLTPSELESIRSHDPDLVEIAPEEPGVG